MDVERNNDSSFKTCPRSNPYRIVFGTNFPDGAITAFPGFSGQVRLGYRLRDIIGFRVLYFYCVRNATHETTPNFSHIKLLKSSYLGGLIKDNGYFTIQPTLYVQNTVVTETTDVIAINAQASADLALANSVSQNLQFTPQIYKFVKPQVIEYFDWRVDGLFESPLAFTANGVNNFECCIEFYPQCFCK